MEENPNEFINVPTQQDYGGVPVLPSTEELKNIVAQINPNKIISDLDKVFKGQYRDDEGWKMNPTGKALINDACRGYIVGFVSGILNNSTTMGNIDEKRLSFLMESVIDTITKNFTTRLEEFGFVPPGVTYDLGIYENKGTPDSARMTMIANMVYIVCFMVFTRPLKGQESIRIFKSLSMVDNLSQGMYGMPQQGKKSWIGKIFGGR